MRHACYVLLCDVIEVTLMRIWPYSDLWGAADEQVSVKSIPNESDINSSKGWKVWMAGIEKSKPLTRRKLADAQKSLTIYFCRGEPSTSITTFAATTYVRKNKSCRNSNFARFISSSPQVHLLLTRSSFEVILVTVKHRKPTLAPKVVEICVCSG